MTDYLCSACLDDQLTVQSTATIERILSDAGHSARDCQPPLQSRAVVEGIVSDTRQCLGQSQFAQHRTTAECRITDLIKAGMQFHRHKTDAALEGVVSDACYTARDRHFRQTGAVLEGRGADTGHAVGDRYLTAVAEIGCQHAVIDLEIAGSADALQPGRAGQI